MFRKLLCSTMILLAFSQVNAGVVTMDPTSNVRAEGRDFWWGHLNQSTLNTALPGSGTTASAQQEGYNPGRFFGANSGFTNTQATPGEVTFGSTTFVNASQGFYAGYARATSTTNFNVDAGSSYDLNWLFSQSGAHNNKARVALFDIDNSVFVFDTGFNLFTTSTGGSTSGVIAAGNYQFLTHQLLDGNHVNSMSSGQGNATLAIEVPGPASALIFLLGLAGVALRTRS